MGNNLVGCAEHPTVAIPSLDSVSLQAPSVEHGTTAAAKAPFIEAGGRTARSLGALGFKDLGNQQYEHPDGSWIQFNADRDSWERGVGDTQFRGMPTPISEWPSTRYKAADHGWHAVSYLKKMDHSNLKTAGKKLESRGFVQVLPSYYTHADGSFVAITAGKLHCGVNGTRLTRVPKPGTRKKPKGTKPKPKHEVYSILPFKDDWSSWRSNFAVAKLPRADGSNGDYTPAELRKILKHLGFKKVSAELWRHPDGSEVDVDGGVIDDTRFQRWDFGEMPYERRYDVEQWQIDTDAWTDWVEGDGTPPFPAG